MWRVIASVTHVNTVDVTTPDGAAWQVRVVWMPRWRALARRFGGWRRERGNQSPRPKGERGGGLDVPNVDVGGGNHGGFWNDLGDDIFIAVVVIVGMIVFGLVFWWVLLPLLLLVVDGMVIIALAAAAIPARVFLGRPWTVEAVREGDRVTREVAGGRRATQTRDELAEQLRLGVLTPPQG